MADYEKMYRLQSAPTARNDGSGCVDHDIWMDYRLEGSGDSWSPVPGKHKTVSVPAADILDALDSGANSQKIAAYKNALASNLNPMPIPNTSWTLAQVEAQLDANDQAVAAQDAFLQFADDIGVTFPVRFNV